MKCSNCGLESDIPEAFLVKKEWAGLVKRTYCPACREKIFIREQLFSILLVAVFLAVLDSFTFRHGAWSVTADMVFLIAVTYPVIAAHELAHASAGRLLGVRVFAVRVGYGRKLFSRRGFGISWEVNLWPFGGGTLMAAPPQSGNRARMFGAVLAGPAVHVLLLAATAVFQIVLLILQGWAGIQAAGVFHWTSLFLFLNLVLLAGNLLPTRSGGAAGQLGTDGWQLLHLLLQNPKEESNRSQAYFMMESRDASERDDNESALQWIERGMAAHPDQPLLILMRGTILLKIRRFAEARDAFLSLLSSDEAKDPYRKYILYNNVAYTDVLIRNPDLWPEADRYSGEALRQIGWEASVIGTRGAVLTEIGRMEEGILLLKQALAESREDSGKASNAFHLAVAEQRRGNEAESRRYLALTRKYDPYFYLLDYPGWGLPAAATPAGL